MNNKVLRVIEQIIVGCFLAGLLYYYVIPFMVMFVTVVLGVLGLI